MCLPFALLLQFQPPSLNYDQVEHFLCSLGKWSIGTELTSQVFAYHLYKPFMNRFLHVTCKQSEVLGALSFFLFLLFHPATIAELSWISSIQKTMELTFGTWHTLYQCWQITSFSAAGISCPCCLPSLHVITVKTSSNRVAG